MPLIASECRRLPLSASECLRSPSSSGFRGFDTRRAALWMRDGAAHPLIVYPAAAVVVVYNLATHEQRHFREHKDDVLGIAVHRSTGL